MTSGGQSEKAVVEWLAGQKGAMLSLLEEIVNIDGGSYEARQPPQSFGAASPGSSASSAPPADPLRRD